jgi:VCBS repeat-containing protein
MTGYIRSGSEFIVNTTAPRTQAQSDGTLLANGNFVITWIDANFNTTAGRFVRAQIFQPDGTAVGTELSLDAPAGSDPTITGLAGGGFVITWTSLTTMYAQIFDASGAATGSRLTIPAGNSAQYQDIAALANGGFAITWHDTRTTGGDISGTGVRVSTFDQYGTAVTSQLLVNTVTSGNQADVSIAAFPGGGYVVTWTDRSASPWRAKGQLFDTSDNKVGSEFQIDINGTASSSVETSVTTLANGNFAVSWYSGGSEHRVQIFSATGTAVGSPISVPTSLNGIQVGPVIAGLSDGGFVIGWKADSGAFSDGSGAGIFIQTYDASGLPVGGRELVNSQIGGDQILPSIVALANGGFVVNWTDLNAPGADNDSVRAQIFMPDTGTTPATDVIITSAGGGAAGSVEALENERAVTFVRATPATTSGPIVYAITGGDDAASFTIDANSGLLRFVAAPDFEAPADFDGNNSYEIVVTASDGVLSDSQTLSIVVPDLNEGPTITSASSFAISENTAVAGTIAATDKEGESIIYVLDYPGLGGPVSDNDKFYLNQTTGVLTFSPAPNYEAPTDQGKDNVYNVRVRAVDANGSSSAVQTITITVANVAEGTVITSNGGGATAAFSIAENQTIATTVVARDQVGPSITYSISGGNDAARFAIDATTGVLSFVTAPNYEAFGYSRVFDVIVKATDGLQADTQTLAITLTDVNEAPVITSYGGGATASVTFNENGTGSAAVVTATDPENQTRTYSIIGGADAARFTIGSGYLYFVGAPNFEAPTDAGADNVYDVIVQVSDGTLTDTQALAIAVLNVNDAPVITSPSNVSVAENSTAVITVTSTDEENQTRSYSISGGVDAARFTINSVTGALSFVAAPNYETPNDSGANRVYNINVAASDGTASKAQSLTITVTNVEETPVITSSGTFSVAENNLVVATVTANDSNSFAIVGGADAARFTINATSGALRFVSAPNFEAPTDAGADNVYDVIVQASDGSLIATQAIAVAVTNVNEAPVITSPATFSVAENTTAVTTITSTDPENQTRTYSIVGGADSARFLIDPATGALSFAAAPNYEAPNDVGANRVYNVNVAASDGAASATKSLAITVTNVNEAPVITSNGGGATAGITIDENSTVVTTVTATDPENTARSYAIAGGADAALFSIHATTGALQFLAGPDFETPADADANNVYDVVVQASDGSLTDTQAIAVTIADLGESMARASDSGSDRRIDLMRQDMASFGVRQGEGDFGGAREREKIAYDYFA